MVAPAPVAPLATVPRLWPGETIVLLASGPSLCAEDVDYCRGRARVIAVKDAIQLAPWADVLYACGSDSSQWWDRHGDRLKDYAGLRYTLDPKAARFATVLRNTGTDGLELDPSGVRTGMNSTYQAMNVAVHVGARRIVLLGADMAASPNGAKYFFGNRPSQITSPFLAFREKFATLVEPLQTLGVRVVNCSRTSALEVFERMSLAEALS